MLRKKLYRDAMNHIDSARLAVALAQAKHPQEKRITLWRKLLNYVFGIREI